MGQVCGICGPGPIIAARLLTPNWWTGLWTRRGTQPDGGLWLWPCAMCGACSGEPPRSARCPVPIIEPLNQLACLGVTALFLAGCLRHPSCRLPYSASGIPALCPRHACACHLQLLLPICCTKPGRYAAARKGMHEATKTEASIFLHSGPAAISVFVAHEFMSNGIRAQYCLIPWLSAFL